MIAGVVGCGTPAVPALARLRAERHGAVGAIGAWRGTRVRGVGTEILRDRDSLVAIHRHRDREHRSGVERPHDPRGRKLLERRAMRDALVDLLVTERAVLGVYGFARSGRGRLRRRG